MNKIILTCLLILIQFKIYSQTGIEDNAFANVDQAFTNFMTKFKLEGGVMAIAKDGKLIYNRGFGSADLKKSMSVQPYHQFRIGSISKTITAIGIMKLIDKGQLSVSDLVFGKGKILEDDYYLSEIKDSMIYTITIQHLLEHSAGWDRDETDCGLPNCEPNFFQLDVAGMLRIPSPVGDSSLIKYILRYPLTYKPGEHFGYTGISYVILGKVIEKISKMKYEDYMRTHVFEPAGICDVAEGRTLLENKYEREGEYNAEGEKKSVFGTGEDVPAPYGGGFYLESMTASGGWVATASDLVKLVLAVDSFDTKPDILKKETIALMRAPSASNSGYAKGWEVEGNDWMHFGSLAGTSAAMVRRKDGYVLAFIFNNERSGSFKPQLTDLPQQCIEAIGNIPAYDLFGPSVNVTAIAFEKSGDISGRLSWINGNGTGRIIVATEGDALSSFPVDNVNYNASPHFGDGENLGNKIYVVYNGQGNSTIVTGLDPQKNYSFTAFEYTKNDSTGNNQVYSYGCRSTASLINEQLVMSTEQETQAKEEIAIHPNPTQETLKIVVDSINTMQVELYNTSGEKLISTFIKPGENIDISSLKPGLILVKVKSQGKVFKKKILKL
jgi:CubicO group peptidase (beta-lactamase class C family)